VTHPLTLRLVPLLAATLLASPALAAPAKGPADLAAARARMVSDLATLHFERLGNPVLHWDHIPPVYAPRERPHMLLVVLVEFADLGFVRFGGDAEQGKKLAAWYQDYLFDEGYSRPDTLSDYYRSQSLGTYHIGGQVLAPVKLARPRRDYGSPKRPKGGSWRNDSETEGMVEEALGLAVQQHPGVPWTDFDRWDPTDFDGDGVLDEADGYLDHFVLIYAGGGQASCHLLHKLSDALTPNVGPEVLDGLAPEARECADRLWPHRFSVQKREGQGPLVEGRTNARGGTPLSPSLWVLDYNMQSEYTSASTFIHEFGHSIGLPDLYARASTNSTGLWDVMSATRSPSPQNMSAWSRMMLGWLVPSVVLPPSHGGRKVQSAYLRALDEPAGDREIDRAASERGLTRAVMAVLPPKTRELSLTKLPSTSGTQALYSGQGNQQNRTVELRLDLRTVRAAALTLSFDAWWEIEAGWDFAYLETSTDGGRTWRRRVPTDRGHMPAKHGHDGKETLPGFTGLSGDLDGDGKNEGSAGCDPAVELKHGEDKAGQEKSPCLVPSWVRPSFDVSDLRGHRARVRLRYFTDMAAVMRGILIDNVTLEGGEISEDFEGRLGRAWRLGGFTASSGRHTLLVPHYYLFEYRDPYPAAGGEHRYDAALARPFYHFYSDPAAGVMRALRVRPRPGVVAWYYNGAYAWSENEPTENGQGRGYLLVVDSNPNELRLPGLDRWFVGTPTAYDTHYDVKAEAAQRALTEAYYRTICYVRSADYRPRDLDPAALSKACTADAAPVAGLAVDDKRLMYTYQVVNELLPGQDRDAVQRAGELLDYKVRKGERRFRVRDRSLRHLHSYDAPFSLTPFSGGVELFDIGPEGLKRASASPHPATRAFSDATPSRWLNPKLYFGGVALPDERFAFELAEPKEGAPDGARVKVWLLFDE